MIICKSKREVTVLKIIVFSDSHGDAAGMVDVLERERPDRVFHLGDYLRDAEELEWAYPDLHIDMVAGNCDWHSSAAREQILDLQGCRLLLCHGHTYGVKNGLSALARAAREQQADVALFGHTHEAHSSRKMGVSLCNPGSCGMGLTPTYGLLTIANGQAVFEIRPVYGEE